MSSRVRPGELGGQGPRLIVSTGKRKRALAVSHDLYRMSDRCKPYRKGARSAAFNSVCDPQDVGLRFSDEKALDCRQRGRAVRRVGNRRERTQSTVESRSVERRNVLSTLREGP